MKIDKKFFICAMLVLMLFLCVNASSATEPLNQTLGADTSDEIAVSDAHNDKLSASGETFIVDESGQEGYTQIVDAVGNATGGEIILIKNGEYVEEKAINTGTKSLTFVGESQDGVIIKSAGQFAGLFVTTSTFDSLVFCNLTFMDISSDKAPIEIGGAGNINITNCTFINCHPTHGSICVYNSGTTVIDGCTILNSRQGGAYGCAITFRGSVVANYILKNTLVNNATTSTSGAHAQAVVKNENGRSTVTIDNLTITNCTSAYKSLSLVSTSGNMNVKNSIFMNNNVSNKGIFMISVNSGVNPTPVLTVESCAVINNTEPYLLYTNSKKAVFNLNYNNIQNNTMTGFSDPGNVNDPILENNWWGSNDLPDGVSANVWIVNEEGKYVLCTGEELEKYVPFLYDSYNIALPENAIYVKQDGDDSKDGSDEDNAVQTISRAVDIARNRVNKNSTIYLLNGEYATNAIEDSSLSLTILGQDKNRVIVHGNENYIFKITGENLVWKFENIKFAGANSPSQASGAIISFSSSTTGNDYNLNIINCSFTNNPSEGNYLNSVFIENANANIEESTFISSGDVGSSVHVASGNLDISGSAILQKGNYALTKEDSATVTANNNWWGNNNNANTEIPVDKWIIMNVTPDSTIVLENSVIEASFFKTNSTGGAIEDYTGSLSSGFNVTFKSDAGLDKVVRVIKNKARIAYTPVLDDNILKVASSDVIFEIPVEVPTIYVSTSGKNTNNGKTRETAVKDIDYAVGLSQYSKIIILEGYHILNNAFTIERDSYIIIEGEGDVIIDLMSHNIFDNSAKVKLSNLKFINGSNVDDRALMYTWNGDLGWYISLDNVEFYNNHLTC